MDRDHPKSFWTEWGLVTSGLLLALALLALGMTSLSRARELRCYSLTPPSSPTPQSVTSSQTLVCMAHRCRVVFRWTPERSLACFFSPSAADARALPGGAGLTGGGVTARALQRSSGPRAYRTA